MQSFYGDKTRPNLICSTDYGKSYSPCPGVDRPIVQVEKVIVGEHTWVFALPSYNRDHYNSDSAFEGAKGFYVSYDSSNTFVFHQSQHHFEYILPHPVNGEELLAFIQDDSLVEYAVDDLYYVDDYRNGAPKETLLEKYVHVAEWSTSETAGSEHDLFVTQYRTEPGSGDDEIEPLDFIRIRSPGSASMKKTLLKENCYDFLEETDFLFATEVPSVDGFDERTLFVSTDEGDIFNEAVFPFTARHNHFKVVDATEGVVFVLVQHTLTRVEGGTFVFRVDSPTSIAGNYSASKSLFSPVIPGGVISGEVFIETDNPNGCSETGGISPAAKGKIVVVNRGTCYFTEKARNAESAGAIGVVIVNHDDNLNFRMAGQGEEIDIPTYVIKKSTGDALATARETITVSLIEEFVEEQEMRKTSNLFVSDPTGITFTLSLDEVVYIPYYESAHREIADVHKVNGQPGTYLASYFSVSGIETLISFNKGGSWREIAPPAQSECGTLDHCHLSVSLDAYLALEDIPLPLSTTNAPGVIIANAAASHNTYPSMHISTDGGLTWTQQNSRPYAYMMLDHGGVIIAAESHTTSDDVLITLDFGADGWTALKVSDTNEYMQMISEPGSATLEASVYFYNSGWFGTYFNLRPLFPRACNLNNAGDANGDYDIVSPGDKVGSDNCLLGREHHFLRRAPCRRCYNGLDHEAKFESEEDENVINCKCDIVDYACAPGFARDETEIELRPCAYDPNFNMQFTCTGNGDTTLVHNYVKVVGDVCSGGNYEAVYEGLVEVPCVHQGASSSSNAKTVAIAIPVTIIVVVLVVVLIKNRSRLPTLASMPSLSRRSASVQYHAVEHGNDDSDDDDNIEGLDDDDIMLEGEQPAEQEDENNSN
eukprot:m.28877 g.28877  ORF g.28877 m.28877 type:complete len:879 (+) comp9517_c0_seq1:767-3403(+)